MQALAEQSRLVRLPLNQVGLLNKINKTIADFVQEHERQPSLHELARLVDVDESKIAETLSASSRGASLDAPFQDGEENSLISVLSDDNAPAADNGMDLESLSTDLEQILKELKPREIQVLKMSFGIGCNEKTLEEIADTLGLTRERVRQIREKSLKKLRDTAGADMLRKYLG
jgi:RNA polymerase primary sigma factor